jgi:hypothetical protein
LKDHDYTGLIIPLESISFAKSGCKPNVCYIFREHVGVRPRLPFQFRFTTVAVAPG